MLRTFSIFTAIAAALSVPIVASSGANAGSAPIDDVATPTSTSVGPDGESAGTVPPLEVVHVETDTNFADMSTQGTVLFAETMAPTDSAQPGWWLRIDVTVRNNGDQPIEVTELGITTEPARSTSNRSTSPVVVALAAPRSSSPTTSPAAAPADVVHRQLLRAGLGAVPCPGHLSARDLRRRHHDGRFPVPRPRRGPARRRVLDARRLPRALTGAALRLRPQGNSLGSRPRGVDDVHRASLRRRSERHRTRLEERAPPHLGTTRLRDGEWLERFVSP